MSIASELKKRAGPRVRVRDAQSHPSRFAGEPTRLVLNKDRSEQKANAFEVARLLVRAGVPVRTAKKIVDDLWANKPAAVEVSSDDLPRLVRSLSRQSVKAREIRLHEVDIKNLRARLGISQEAFAIRYCLDVATVRNWEQGRTQPEGPAAALLQIIERAPNRVLEILAPPTGAAEDSDSEIKENKDMLGDFISECPLVVRKYGQSKLTAFASRVSQKRRLLEFAPDELS